MVIGILSGCGLIALTGRMILIVTLKAASNPACRRADGRAFAGIARDGAYCCTHCRTACAASEYLSTWLGLRSLLVGLSVGWIETGLLHRP